MTRRDALARVSLILGGTLVGAEAFLSGCQPAKPPLSSTEFNETTVAFLDEVGETIIPTTASSPGAKAAQIGEFMKTIVTDCYEADDQQVFMAGIGKLEEAAKLKYAGKSFVDLDDAAKKELLTGLDAEAKAYDKAKTDPQAPAHYFSMMKQLTLWGYFTSEIGSNQALRYLEVPGPYQGCIPYTKGDRAWAQA
ncbi:MAG: gluconate 2-dehydrogenase subunit 3 family protein [Bacteroidia bacterium]|nr:gluconate 2-dehydrogenase subunit 3 family protein [Bacteroidia bacterium]